MDLLIQPQSPANHDVVSRSLLRQKLAALSMEDFEVFVLDAFYTVYQTYFSFGMDRLHKTNILLAIEQPNTISAALANFHERPAKAQAKSNPPHRPQVPEQAVLRGELEKLYQERAELLKNQQSTGAINDAIRVLRRSLRDGPQLRVGDTLSEGRYRLLRRLGHGGFATVFEAYDQTQLGVVAIKILHGQFARDGTHIERFYRGARFMETLHHPYVCEILEGPQEDDGFHFFVMQCLSGGDLEHAVLEGRLSREAAVEVVLQAGDALELAHKKGLVHRDFKPSNILLDENRQAYLTDFDLVWAEDTTGGTRTGGIGTFIYAAPEATADAKRIDKRADVYSLGMTLAFVLCGRRLSHEAIRQTDAFIERLDCPRSLRKVLKRSLAVDAKNRYGSVAALCNAVRIATRPRRVRNVRTARLLAMGAGATVALILVGAYAEVRKLQQQEESKRSKFDVVMKMKGNRSAASTSTLAPTKMAAAIPPIIPNTILPPGIQQPLLTAVAPTIRSGPEPKKEIPPSPPQLNLTRNAAALLAYQRLEFPRTIEIIAATTSPDGKALIQRIKKIQSLYDAGLVFERSDRPEASKRYSWAQEIDIEIRGGLRQFFQKKLDKLKPPNKDAQADKFIAEAKLLAVSNPTQSRNLCRQTMQLYGNSPKNPKVRAAYYLLNSIKGGKDDDF